MSLYQCERCGCVENTACGWYHCRDASFIKTNVAEEDKGKALCSACGPTKYSDGKSIDGMGKWHERFTRTFYPVGSLYTDQQGNVRRKSDDKYPHEEPYSGEVK